MMWSNLNTPGGQGVLYTVTVTTVSTEVFSRMNNNSAISRNLFSTINKGVNFRKYLHVYRSIVFIVENTSVDSHYSDNCKIPSYVERIENECL